VTGLEQKERRVMSTIRLMVGAILSLGISLAGSTVSATAGCLDDIKAAGVLKVGNGLMGLKPYAWQLGDGTHTGFEKEMLDYVANKLGVKHEYVVTEWTSLIPGLKSKRWDIIWSGMAKTQERMQGGGIDYTEPYFLIFDRIIVLKDSGIKGLADLKGKTLASTLGTMDSVVGHSLVDAGHAAKIIDFNTFGEPFLALRNKDADAVILDETAYLAQRADMPDLTVVGDPLYYIPKPEWKEAEEKSDYRLGALGVGVRLDCGDLKDAISSAIAEMDKDGTRRKILESYGIWSDDQAKMKKN
jgi:ABC-type amino acid transport substrate-binding protein